MIQVNNKISHNIYFSYRQEGVNSCKTLTLQGDKEECKDKANAWLQWEVSPSKTIKGEWEETDYLTFFFRQDLSLIHI